MKKLYLDIETVPVYANFNLMPEAGKICFRHKFQSDLRIKEFNDDPTTWLEKDRDIKMDFIYEQIYQEKASFHAEFSKICTIGMGYVSAGVGPDAGNMKVILKAIGGENELTILLSFLKSFSKLEPDLIVAHNGTTFDFPFLARRILINGLLLPEIFKAEGKATWQMPWVDTMKFWAFTDYRHTSSLATLAYVFEIPSPKEVMDGSQVHKLYLLGQHKDIASYCLTDVFTLINVDYRLRGENAFEHCERHYDIAA